MPHQTADLPFTNSHLPIRYHLSFTRLSDTWLMANNLANGKWLMVNATEGGVW